MNSILEKLKPFQTRIMLTAALLVAMLIIGSFFFGVFLLIQAFTQTFANVLWPLAVAAILAMINRPVVRWIEIRCKLKRTTSIVILYLFVFTGLITILALVLPILFEQTLAFIHRSPQIWENLSAAVATKFPKLEEFAVSYIGEARLQSYKAALETQIETALGYLPSAAVDVFAKIQGIAALATGLAIIPVYLFFFLRSDRDFTADFGQQLSFLKKEWRDDILFLIREFADSIESFFRGQILIGLIIGVLLAILFSLCGINFGIGLGLMIGALNIIPYLGTIIGLATVLPIAYFQPDGGAQLVLFALGSFGFVQFLEGYVLTPKIMGDQTGLHPLTIIIAIFFWGVALDGLLGMVLAIPLTAFFVVAWRLAKKKYLIHLSGDNEPPSDTLAESTAKEP